MNISVQAADFDLGAELSALSQGNADIGAVASFVGHVRGGEVLAMTLEHYPGMTEATLREIANEAMRRWNLYRISIIHRIGRLLPGEQIVFVGVASAHRQSAFAGCEYIVDFLKTRAPFWKYEETTGGNRWVEAKAADQNALERWR